MRSRVLGVVGVLLVASMVWGVGTIGDEAPIRPIVPRRGTEVDSSLASESAALPQPAAASTRERPTPTRGPSVERRLRGCVVDVSGRPVPFFTLELAAALQRAEAPGATEHITTDEEGRFCTRMLFPPGEVTISLSELEDRARLLGDPSASPEPLRYDVAFGESSVPEEVVVRVDVGPGVWVDCSALKEVGSSFIGVLSDRPDGGQHAFRTHLIREPSPFLRFPPVAEASLSSLRFVAVASTSDHWEGAGEVDTWDVLPSSWARVRLTLRQLQRVELALEFSGGVRPCDVTVTAWEGSLDPRELEQQEPWFELTPGGSASRDRIGGTTPPVPVGPVTYRVQAEGFLEHLATTAVVQGRNTWSTTMHRDPEAAMCLTGRVFTASGEAPTGDWRVFARSRERGPVDTERSAELRWSNEGGRWSAPFALSNLLPDDYQVVVAPAPRTEQRDPWPLVEPRMRIASGASALLEFVILDEEPIVDVIVRVTDGHTGQPIPRFKALLLTFGEARETQPAEGRGGMVRLQAMGDLAKARIWVSAPGYAASCAALPAPSGGDREVRARFRLVPGWAAPLATLLEGEDTLRPLDGVRILADGQWVATTDGRGECWLGLPERPTKLEAVYPGHGISRAVGPIDDQGRLAPTPPDEFDERFVLVLRGDR